MKITANRTYRGATPPRPGALEKGAFGIVNGNPADEIKQNVDRIDISSSAIRAEIEKSARSITQQVTQPADVQRLENLRKSVREQSYHVPTERLVDAMMSWRML